LFEVIENDRPYTTFYWSVIVNTALLPPRLVWEN